MFDKLTTFEKAKKNPPKYTFAFQNLKSVMVRPVYSQTNSRLSSGSLTNKLGQASKEALDAKRRETGMQILVIANRAPKSQLELMTQIHF